MRTGAVWTDDDEARFLAKAPAHLHLPLILASGRANARATSLSLPWSAYDGSTIRLAQGKTGARVVVPVGAPLKARLDAAPRKGATILVNSDGRPWTSDGFRASWRKACATAGITGLTFHDLRGTAVSRLALAECTVPEIATLTGAFAAQRRGDPRQPLSQPGSGHGARGDQEAGSMEPGLPGNFPTNRPTGPGWSQPRTGKLSVLG